MSKIRKGKSYRYYLTRVGIVWRRRLGLCAEGWHRGYYDAHMSLTMEDGSVLDRFDMLLCRRHARGVMRGMVKAGGEVTVKDAGNERLHTVTGTRKLR